MEPRRKLFILWSLYFARWLFIRRIGGISREFHKLAQASERAAFLAGKFGRAMNDASKSTTHD